MKNQYQLQSLPYETIEKIIWSIQNKKLVTVYEKLMSNKKILYLFSIQKTEKEVAEIMEVNKKKIENLVRELSGITGCKGKLGLIQVAYRLKIIN